MVLLGAEFGVGMDVEPLGLWFVVTQKSKTEKNGETAKNSMSTSTESNPLC
jgi:hypothetical protein